LAFFACFFGDTPVVEERASHFPLCAWRTVSDTKESWSGSFQAA